MKDFSHFCDRAVHVDEKLDPLSGHLFALKGEKWKHLRYVCDHSSNFGRGQIRRDFQDQDDPNVHHRQDEDDVPDCVGTVEANDQLPGESREGGGNRGDPRTVHDRRNFCLRLRYQV